MITFPRFRLPLLTYPVLLIAATFSQAAGAAERPVGVVSHVKVLSDKAEAILQLRADYLSDGDVVAHFWQRRQDAATGQRCYRPRD